MFKNLPLVFVLVTVAIDAIGIGIIIPVMPDLIKEVGGASIADAALWGGVLAASFSFMQFLCGPTVGNLSDRYGRRPVLLISLLFMALDYVIMGVAHVMVLLFIGRVVGGITASTPATVGAYIADISKSEDKAKNFGLIGACFGVGFVLGPLFGAFFAEFGTRTPFFVAAIIAFANFVLGYFVLPETVTDEIRRSFEWRRANPIGSLYHIGKLPGLKLLLLIFFLIQIAFAVYPAIWSFYGIERFGWGPTLIGVSLACYGVMLAFVQGWFIRFILKYLTEKQTVIFGFFFEIIGFIGYGIIKEEIYAFILIPFGALGAVGIPALQGIMSRIAAPNQQGELQGLFTSLTSLAFILSPLIMTGIFYMFVDPEFPIYMPGAPFLFAAIVGLICFGLIHLVKESDYGGEQKIFFSLK